MNLKQVLLIFVVCLVVFVPGFRAFPFGFDSYYYLNVVCNGAEFVKNEPFLSRAIFSLMPCNIPLILSINFFLMFGCCLFSAALSEHFLPKNGWLSGILVLASIIFTLSFFQVESEPFAYFLCLAAVWLFYSRGRFWKVLAIGLVLVASQFWLGSLVVLVAFALSEKILLPLLALVFLFKWREVIGQFLPNLEVQENWPGYGLFYQGTLFVSMLYLKHLRAIFVPTTFFMLLAFVNMKFAFFAASFLAILAAKQTALREVGWLRLLPFFGVAFCAFFLWMASVSFPPSQHDIEAVRLAVFVADGNVVCNQWGYGHLVEFFGGRASDKAGGRQQCVSCRDCVMLSFFDQPGCSLLLGDENSLSSVKVYRC